MAIAEAKLRGEAIALADVRAAIAGLFDGPDGPSIDTVVLACTHFPLLADELASAVPHPVRFVDGGPGIARRIAHLTVGQDWPEKVPAGIAVVTRLDDATRALAPAFAARGFAEPIQI